MPRPEITGKKIGGTAMELDAYSITEFCKRHSISVPMYYKMRLQGLGPAEFRLGTRVLITREAAAKWRKERERASA
jgi:hypothetical protein